MGIALRLLTVAVFHGPARVITLVGYAFAFCLATLTIVNFFNVLLWLTAWSLGTRILWAG